MVSFRRWITALAVLALFTGIGMAQIQVGSVSNTGAGSLLCTAAVAAPPTLRAEGMTDQIGDIVITCTGGITPAVGSALPVVNFTVSLGTNVTSRLMSNSGTFLNTCSGAACPSNTSEALLMIDEPGSITTASATALSTSVGIGGAAAQTLCTDSAIGASDATKCAVAVATTTCTGPGCGGLATLPVTYMTGPNIYAGLVSGNQVTFEGIPILPPATTGLARVYRITNVRANISGLSAGLAGTTPLTASVAISNYVAVNNPVQTAGFIQAGLATSVRNKSNSSSLHQQPDLATVLHRRPFQRQQQYRAAGLRGAPVQQELRYGV